MDGPDFKDIDRATKLSIIFRKDKSEDASSEVW